MLTHSPSFSSRQPPKKIGERFCDMLGDKADKGEVVAARDTFGEGKED